MDAVKAPGVGILGAAHAAPSPMSSEAQDGLQLAVDTREMCPEALSPEPNAASTGTNERDGAARILRDVFLVGQ